MLHITPTLVGTVGTVHRSVAEVLLRQAGAIGAAQLVLIRTVGHLQEGLRSRRLRAHIAVIHICFEVTDLTHHIEEQALGALELEDLAVEAEKILGALTVRPDLVDRPVGIAVEACILHTIGWRCSSSGGRATMPSVVARDYTISIIVCKAGTHSLTGCEIAVCN